MNTIMSSCRAILVGGLAAILAAGACAQGFPSRAIRIVVPFAAGGPTDQVGRMVAQRLAESTGQSVLVDNRPGAGAQIGATQLMQAPADGHTLFIGDMGALAVNPSLYANLSFDPLRDFQPITLLMSAPMVIVVPAASPVTSVADLVARARSTRMSFASQGIGTGGHLLGEMLNTQIGARMVHVPYKGGAPAMQDLIAGQVDVFFEVMGATLPQSRGGKLKMLAVAADKRSAFAPDLPSTEETGLGTVKMAPWFGIVARAGTPDPVIRRLNGDITAAMAHPDITKRLSEVGFDPIPGSPEQFAAFMRSEAARWGAVVKATGAKVD